MQKRYGSVDGLKYVLMMLVVTCHYYNTLAFTDDNLPRFIGSYLLFHWSHLAVEVFFLISGFFMASAVKKHHESLMTFVFRRIKRLYPLAIMSTILYVVIRIIFVHFDTSKFECDVWTLLLSLTNTTRWMSNKLPIYNGPLWYIQPLILCEILLFVVESHKRKKNDGLLEVSFLIVFASLGLKLLNLDVPFFNESIMRGVFNYFLGVAVYECTKKKNINWKGISIIFCAITLVILGIGIFENSVYHIGNFQLCVSFIISPACLLACLHLNPVKKLLAPMAYLGKTTYSILSTHMIVIFFMGYFRRAGMDIDLTKLSTYVCCLLISTLVGVVCYELIEKRLIPWLLLKLSCFFIVQEA